MFLPIEELLNNKESRKQVNQTVMSINECLQTGSKTANGKAILAAYTLYKARTSETPFSVSYEDIKNGKLDISNDILNTIKDVINENAWVKLVELLPKYAPDIFAAAVFLPIEENIRSNSFSTPASIIKLAQRILQCVPGNQVIDIGYGTGAFILSAALGELNAQYVGYEINPDCYMVSKIRAELLGVDIQLYLKDAFTLSASDGIENKFDKVFSNYPFGLRARNLSSGVDYLKKLRDKDPRISRATSSDWIFNALLCDILDVNGKAIGIMTNGSMWNTTDLAIRRYLIESGMIECVISMPSKMFSVTNIPTSLIIFSHGNQKIRLIDATNMCQKGRRQNEFSDENIQTILKAMTDDSEYSKAISVTGLEKNEYNLNLSRYHNAEKGTIENGIPFKDVINSITRGVHCTARELDAMASEHVTDIQYLKLSNIQDGIIEDNLPYLDNIEPKFEKYCLKNNNLILSKTGAPYKVAVAIVPDGKKILANGNLYIIDVDETKVNPYYLKAFFESEHGAAALHSISVGSVIPNIGVDKLKKLLIPVPAIEEQERIAQRYQAVMDEIAVLKLKLEKAFDRLKHTFDTESEG